MKLLLLIIFLLALCSGGALAWIAFETEIDKWADLQKVRTIYGTIITDQEAKIVHDYHGILSMKWSIPHKDFVFERNGEICRARAFEILKERK